MQASIHTYIHTYDIHTYMHTYMHTTYMQAYIPTYMHTDTPPVTYIKTNRDVSMHAYIHSYIYIHTYRLLIHPHDRIDIHAQHAYISYIAHGLTHTPAHPRR